MNKTLFRKFISWFWGLIYLLPLLFLILELFRNGYTFGSDVTTISIFMSNFEFPLFSDIVNDLLTTLEAESNLGAYILIYLGSWFIFVTLVKFLLLMVYYLICVLEDIIFKFAERVCK